MKKLMQIRIDYTSDKYVHYQLSYEYGIIKRRIKTISVVHDRFHDLLHSTETGQSLISILSFNQQKIAHAKLMMMIETKQLIYDFKQ